MMNTAELEVLTENSLTCARLVNTLSFLEYVGARKLMKALPEQKITWSLLAHAAEEIRHALSLRQIARKLSCDRIDSYEDRNLLGAGAARRYIQSVDQIGAEVLGVQDPELSYAVTTYLLEKRADSFYPMLVPALARFGVKGRIEAIISEEVTHLLEIERLLAETRKVPEHTLTHLVSEEEARFAEWMAALRSEVDSAKSVS